MTDWIETPDGFRQWKRGCGAKWRERGGVLEAFDVNGAPIVTESADIAERTRRAARWLPGMLTAGATPPEARALLAIAAIESAGRDLPVFGDYRTAESPKVSVPASTRGARPLSVGIYQFKRDTARDAGATWRELATSPAANHRAALKHLRGAEPRHGGDFMTLAAIWNAGSISPSPKNDVWGVVSYRPSTLTSYAAAYNAAGDYVRDAAELYQGARDQSGDEKPALTPKPPSPIPSDPRFTPVFEPHKPDPWGAFLGIGAALMLASAVWRRAA